MEREPRRRPEPRPREERTVGPEQRLASSACRAPSRRPAAPEFAPSAGQDRGRLGPAPARTVGERTKRTQNAIDTSGSSQETHLEPKESRSTGEVLRQCYTLVNFK